VNLEGIYFYWAGVEEKKLAVEQIKRTSNARGGTNQELEVSA